MKIELSKQNMQFLMELTGLEINSQKNKTTNSILEQGQINAQNYLKRQKLGQKLSLFEENNLFNVLVEIKKILNLAKIPRRIECYDISHLSGTAVFGSMVVFIDGVATKSLYRIFKCPEINDDFASHRQVLTRRLNKISQIQNEVEILQKALEEVENWQNYTEISKNFDRLKTEQSQKSEVKEKLRNFPKSEYLNLENVENAEIILKTRDNFESSETGIGQLEKLSNLPENSLKVKIISSYLDGANPEIDQSELQIESESQDKYSKKSQSEIENQSESESQSKTWKIGQKPEIIENSQTQTQIQAETQIQVPNQVQGEIISQVDNNKWEIQKVENIETESEENESQKLAQNTTILDFEARIILKNQLVKKLIVTKKNLKDWQLPDLIIVDGGKGQLSADFGVLQNFGELAKNIEIISLAKKEEEIFTLKDIQKDLDDFGANLEPNSPIEVENLPNNFGQSEIEIKLLEIKKNLEYVDNYSQNNPEFGDKITFDKKSLKSAPNKENNKNIGQQPIPKYIHQNLDLISENLISVLKNSESVQKSSNPQKDNFDNNPKKIISSHFPSHFPKNKGSQGGILLSGAAKFLVQRIRDEAHRFAIKHNRKARIATIFISELDQIIGPKTKIKLLTKFGSVSQIIQNLTENTELVREVVGSKTLEKLQKYFLS